MDRLLSVIEEQSGTVLKDTRLTRVKALIHALITQDMTLRQLEIQLRTAPFDHPLWQQVIQQITVGETYFFRNKGHFNALEKHILPQLIRHRRQNKQLYLRIWIAGTATGEEAYSVAMLLHKLLPDLASWSIFLLATDINLAFLTFARRGIYNHRAFRNETPVELQHRYFSAVTDGYQISPQVQQMVTFMPLNLTESVYPALANNTTSLDLILCRNVTIYFDWATTQAIVNRFYDALRPEGWLLVGHAEPQPNVYDAFTMQNINRAIFYQKPAPVSVAAAPLPALISLPRVTAQATPPTVEAEPSALTSATDVLQVARNAADAGEWQTALDALAEAEAFDRFNPLLYYLRGLVYTHLDQPAPAIDAFRRAIYCEPKFALAHYAIGELLLKQGKTKSAISSWGRAHKSLRDEPPDATVMGADDLTASMLDELLDYRLQ